MQGLPANLKEELSAVRRRLAVAEGERQALVDRRNALAKEVGLAKGRLALKPRVDEFLEELQAEAHQRRVGDFERLLSALVAEVLPGEYPIGLNLEIERGQPSLEIVSRRGVDQAEDIYDDQGGALTNVVSMGLRMIAAVRSRTRRFLVLDESDCWIKNDRVPAFYKVVKEAAGKVGVQCFVISHHDITTFDEGIAVARIHGDKHTGVRIENAPRPHRWQDDEDGIRFIRLVNFQSYVDETLHLAPGVNALTGPNNLGKSSFVRALRAVFYAGEARDSLIRHGEKACTVEIGFGRGRVLQWNRQRRRNPVNMWRLLGPDGAVIEENGMRYDTGGRTPPEWVTDLFGIGPVEGLDVHVAKQKEPVFLLDRPGSTRAAVLSIGQESSHIRAMVALHKERCRQDAERVREGEREMAHIVGRLEALERLSELRDRLESAAALLEAIERRAAETDRLSSCIAAIEKTEGARAEAAARLAGLDRLPTRDHLESLIAEADLTARIENVADRIDAASASVTQAARVTGILSRLPASLPAITPLDHLAGIIRTIEEASESLVTAGRTADVLAALPETMPTIVRSDALIQAGKDIKRKEEAIRVIAAQGNILARLPGAMPGIGDTSGIEKAVEAISSLIVERERLAAQRKTIETETTECERELHELTEAMGHACPVCGGAIQDPTVLVARHLHVTGEHGHAEPVHP